MTWNSDSHFQCARGNKWGTRLALADGRAPNPAPQITTGKRERLYRRRLAEPRTRGAPSGKSKAGGTLSENPASFWVHIRALTFWSCNASAQGWRKLAIPAQKKRKRKWGVGSSACVCSCSTSRRTARQHSFSSADPAWSACFGLPLWSLSFNWRFLLRGQCEWFPNRSTLLQPRVQQSFHVMLTAING